MNGTRVLVVLPLLVGLAHCFSWDIVVSEGNQLKFFYNGTLTRKEDTASDGEILAVIYDPVDFRVLYAEYSNDVYRMSISSYDLTTGKQQTLVKDFTMAKYFIKLVYDPLKQLFFWTEDMSIYSLSLKAATSNKTVHKNRILTLNNNYCDDLAVDSCGGYIYWATKHTIERAAFDGSKKEVLIHDTVYKRRSLVIDQQTQTMFWSDDSSIYDHAIECADLNGKNRRTFYSLGKGYGASALTVSKDYIYWANYDLDDILRFPKQHQNRDVATVYARFPYLGVYFLTAAHYTIEEQTLGIETCEALRNLTHRSKEVQGYGSTCFNYCLKGNCSISAEGLPNCSCEAGYTGERCEMNVCYKHCLHGGVCSLNQVKEPVCQCKAGYEGDRCDVDTTCVQPENTKQEIGQDPRGEVTQVNIEELKRALLFFSDKVDEYEANIEINEMSMKNHESTTDRDRSV